MLEVRIWKGPLFLSIDMVAKIDEDKRCAPANNFGAISVSYIISDEIVDTFFDI